MKKFSPCPVLCNKNIICIQTKNVGQRSSCPAQFSVIKISFTSKTKKFRVRKFSPCPVLCKKKIYIFYIQTKNVGRRSSCPAQFSVKKRIYHLHPYKNFMLKKFSPSLVLCDKNIIYIQTKKLWWRSSRSTHVPLTKSNRKSK